MSGFPVLRSLRSLWFNRPKSVLRREIRVGLFQRDLLDPHVSVTHIVAFGLQLQTGRRVGYAFSAIIAAIDPRVGAAPYFLNLNVGMGLGTIEINGHTRFLHELAVFEAGGA